MIVIRRHGMLRETALNRAKGWREYRPWWMRSNKPVVVAKSRTRWHGNG